MSRLSGHHRIMEARKALVMMVLEAVFVLDTRIGIARAVEAVKIRSQR